MAFFSSKPKDESKSNGKNLKLFSERGFGLIEAIVGMVLVALMGVAAMKTVESLSHNSKVAGAGAELGVLRAQVLTLLSANSQTCIASLKNSAGQVAKFNPDVVLPPHPTPAQIANYRAVNSLSQIELGGLVIAKPGEKSGGLFVRDLILRELTASLRQNTTVAGVSARRFISVLDISLSLDADPTRPTLARGIRLPVILEADSATHALLSCAFGGSQMSAEAPPPSGVITTPAGPFQSGANSFRTNYCYAQLSQRWSTPMCESGYYMKAQVKCTNDDWDGYGAVCCLLSDGSDSRMTAGVITALSNRASYDSTTSYPLGSNARWSIVMRSVGRTYNNLAVDCQTQKASYCNGPKVTCPAPETLPAP